jgi:hypothetical protein
MKKALFGLIVAAALLPIASATESFTNVPVVDVKCHEKAASNPDAHTRACALQCAASGYGIFTSDGKYLKFDAKGIEEMTSELKSSTKKDHLRADVTGDVEGDTIKVTSVKLL